MSSICAAVLRLAIAMVFALAATTVQAQDFPLPCFYSAAGSDEGLAEHLDCARRVGGTLQLAPAHVRALDFDGDGLASVAVAGDMFYLNREGRALHVLTFDNGADYFEEDLVRAWVNGKVGYYDKNLEQVIAPTFDWGTPFAGGRADVCQGCRRGPADGDGHWAMEGGKWGVIDKSGVLVEPLR